MIEKRAEYKLNHDALEAEYFDFKDHKRTLKPSKDLDEFNELHNILYTDLTLETVDNITPTETVKQTPFWKRIFGIK